MNVLIIYFFLVLLLACATGVCVRQLLLSKQRLFFIKDLLRLQNCTSCILDENLTCIRVLSSMEAEKFKDALLDKNFIDIAADAYRKPLKEAALSAVANSFTKDFVFRLVDFLGGDWYSVSFIKSRFDGNFCLIGTLSPIGELMRVQNSEKMFRQRSLALIQSAFDIVWKIDIESRRITLFNDVLEARHGALSRPAGEYALEDIVVLEDYKHFEEKLRTRIQEYLRLGTDVGEGHVLNLRMYAPNGLSVWHTLRGKLIRGDDLKLYMYGVSHRIKKLQFPLARADDFSNMFSLMLESSLLRIFWCNAEGVVLGSNELFKRDFNIDGDVLHINMRSFKGKNHSVLEFFYQYLLEVENSCISSPVIHKFEVTPLHATDASIKGIVEVFPLQSNDCHIEGALFSYSLS